MLTRLEVPEHLHRNALRVVAAGYEHTGQTLIDLVLGLTGFANLSSVDVLDVGCGVRHTMTIINRGIRVRSYTGIEVSRPIVDFLRTSVEAHDPRFHFAHWNVRNALYQPDGMDLGRQDALPVSGSFDLIWLFSVFTHLAPGDAEALLRILRKYVRDDGRLFFSAFIDEDLDGFEDRVKESPLANAYYGRRYMESLIAKAGWRIDYFGARDPTHFIQHHFLCSPR